MNRRQLGQIGVRLGAYVNSGAQLMAWVPDPLWVIANLKETQMDNVKRWPVVVAFRLSLACG